VSDYGVDDRAIEVRSPAEATNFFSSVLCPDRLWGPPSLLYSGNGGVLSPAVKRGQGVMLTTQPHLVPRKAALDGGEWSAVSRDQATFKSGYQNLNVK
jgi:hypothetical protein